MTDPVVIDKSVTSESANTKGKNCTVGEFITETEGWKIVAVAATWEGTPYRAIGGGSVKGSAGDCSGSTNKIYIEAGFPYPYQQTSTFEAYVQASNRFRKIEAKDSPLQAGDILFWPGHMAIYAPFPESDPRHDTGLIKGGNKKNNNMYTAFNRNSTRNYGPFNIEVFRGDKYKAVYRYFRLPTDENCKK